MYPLKERFSTKAVEELPLSFDADLSEFEAKARQNFYYLLHPCYQSYTEVWC